MKKIILIFVFVLVTLVGASAQKKFTYSYLSVGSMTSTGSQSYGNNAIWIDFYNGYINVIGCMRYDYSHKNSNGNYVYINPNRSDDKYVISSDYSEAWNMYEYPWFGRTVTTQHHYKYIGKGSQPAVDIINGNR